MHDVFPLCFVCFVFAFIQRNILHSFVDKHKESSIEKYERLCLCFQSFDLVHSFKNPIFTTLHDNCWTVRTLHDYKEPSPSLFSSTSTPAPYNTTIHTVSRNGNQYYKMAHNTRFETMASRFSPSRLRNSLRRSSSASTSTQASYSSVNTMGSSAAATINSVISRQPSLLHLEAERKSFGSELSLLEPRPIVYWGSVEERMG
jgi:hypothetical protein